MTEPYTLQIMKEHTIKYNIKHLNRERVEL